MARFRIPELPKSIRDGLSEVIAEAQTNIPSKDARHQFAYDWLLDKLEKHDMKNIPDVAEAFLDPLIAHLVIQFAVAAWKAGRKNLAFAG